MRYRTPSGE